MALTDFNVGEIYHNLAEQARTPAAQRLEHWSEARKSYQRSLDLLLELPGHGAFTPDDAALPDQLTKKIAPCDAALAQRPK